MELVVDKLDDRNAPEATDKVAGYANNQGQETRPHGTKASAPSCG